MGGVALCVLSRNAIVSTAVQDGLTSDRDAIVSIAVQKEPYLGQEESRGMMREQGGTRTKWGGSKTNE